MRANNDPINRGVPAKKIRMQITPIFGYTADRRGLSWPSERRSYRDERNPAHPDPPMVWQCLAFLSLIGWRTAIWLPTSSQATGYPDLPSFPLIKKFSSA